MRRPGEKYVPSISLGESVRASARIVLLDSPARDPPAGGKPLELIGLRPYGAESWPH
jgi:hypothetical protein